METIKLNLLIASENPVMISDLARYLHFNFGKELAVANLTNKDTILEQIKEDTHIVVFDKNLSITETPNLNELIALKRPNTHVISYSIKEDLKNGIEAFKDRKMEDRREVNNPKGRMQYFITKSAIYPITFLTEEFKIKKFVAILILTFLTVGIAAIFGYYFI
jgi:hypothetical protein